MLLWMGLMWFLSIRCLSVSHQSRKISRDIKSISRPRHFDSHDGHAICLEGSFTPVTETKNDWRLYIDGFMMIHASDLKRNFGSGSSERAMPEIQRNLASPAEIQHFDRSERLCLLLGFGISFARARRLSETWGIFFPASWIHLGEFSFTESNDSGNHGNRCGSWKPLNSRPCTRSY